MTCHGTERPPRLKAMESSVQRRCSLCGKQDAVSLRGRVQPAVSAQGIRFVQFPPVLNLQLKRFHFDMERMDMVGSNSTCAGSPAQSWCRQVKLNSRFEFPRRLDLSQFAPGAGSGAHQRCSSCRRARARHVAACYSEALSAALRRCPQW